MTKQKPLRVVNNLNASPYAHRLGQYEFVFSSEFNRQRFKNALILEKRNFQARCKKLYGMRVIYDVLTPFVIYRKIERRGYLVRVHNGTAMQCIYSPESIEMVADIHLLPLDG